MSYASQTSMSEGSTAGPNSLLQSHTANVYYSPWDQYVYIDSADTNFSQLIPGTGDFCIEIFIYGYDGGGGVWSFGTSVSGSGTLLLPDVAGLVGVQYSVYGAGNNGFYGDPLGTSFGYTWPDAGATMNLGYNEAWHHLAYIRSGTSMKMFVDGKLLPAFDGGGNPYPYPEGDNNFTRDLQPGQPFYMFGGPLGQYDASNNFSFPCYWRNFRYTLGSTVYDVTKPYINAPNWWEDLPSLTGTKILMVPGPGVTVSSSGFTNESTSALPMTIQNVTPYGNYSTIVSAEWPGPSGFEMNIGTGTNTSQTWTASGTPATPKIVTTATAGAPAPFFGTSCGDFTMTGTNVKINAAGSPTWWDFSPTTYYMIDGWIWVPENISATTRVLMASETNGALGIMMGTGIGQSNGIDQLGIFRVGNTAPDYAASFTWARNRWNYFAIAQSGFTDGSANPFQQWYFFHAVEGENSAQGIPLSVGTQGAPSFTFPASTSVSIGGYSGASSTSLGCYLNMIRVSNNVIASVNALTYSFRGTDIPLTLPPVGTNTVQLMLFQGANGSTSFTNQTF